MIQLTVLIGIIAKTCGVGLPSDAAALAALKDGCGTALLDYSGPEPGTLFWRLPRASAGSTIRVMATTATRETDFIVLNGQRLRALKALLEAAERAMDLCNVWLESGHVADYRAWQTRLRWLDEADRRYRDIPLATSFCERGCDATAAPLHPSTVLMRLEHCVDLA